MYTNSLQLEGLTLKGSLTIYTDLAVESGASLVVDHANDEMVVNDQGEYWPQPKIRGSGSFDVSAGTLTFAKCHLLYGMSVTWNVTGANAKIHVTEDAECGNWLRRYIASDINISSAGELEVDQLVVQDRFETIAKLDLSGGTLDLDGDFKVTGGLDFSGGTIEVAANKAAEFWYE